jgi:uncharacterized protein (DUF488 family)
VPRPLLTLGYGNRELDDVLALVRAHGAKYLIDVRSAPYSRFNPDFSKDSLSAALERAGTRYVFMGDTIGGRPADDACYDEDGHVDYLACSQHPVFQRGFERLRTAWEQDAAVAIFCSELRPEHCHRTKLIAEAMVAMHVPIEHIDADGSLVAHELVMQRLRDPQMSLLGAPGAATRSRRAIATS